MPAWQAQHARQHGHVQLLTHHGAGLQHGLVAVAQGVDLRADERVDAVGQVLRFRARITAQQVARQL
ncbi:MAG: hypothetical protein KDF67_15030, partial [Ottowia sp.]|nr:hypothetical protein [Ottowia sp.]